MSEKIFSSSNPSLAPVASEVGMTPFQGICIGLVVEWARKMLGGTKAEQSKPRERVSRDLTAVAQSFQAGQWKKKQISEDLREAWDGALVSAGLQGISVASGAMTGPQLLAHLCQVIPPGGLGVVSIATPARGATPVIYRGVGLMRQHPGVEPGPLLFFDPAYGLYKCDSPEDFAATTGYLKAYSEHAWAYAIAPA